MDATRAGFIYYRFFLYLLYYLKFLSLFLRDKAKDDVDDQTRVLQRALGWGLQHSVEQLG